MTEDDECTVRALFGSRRVIRDTDQGRALVYLYVWTSLAVPERALRGVGYGALLDLDAFGSTEESLAKEIGKQILGCDVDLTAYRRSNGEAYVIAECPLDDFEKACCS